MTFAGLLASLVACKGEAPPAPVQLQVSEGFSDPIGFYDETPTFSWQIAAADSLAQSAYEVSVEDDAGTFTWSTGKVASNSSTYVPYSGPPLQSRQHLKWRVRLWDQADRVSTWSKPAEFEYGLLRNEDWVGSWIGPPPPTDSTAFGLPKFEPVLMQQRFTLDCEAQDARLYVTARGLFQASLNGTRIGQDEMTPGWTPYHKRLETLTYDVSDLLQQGENQLVIELAEGWYAGRVGYSVSMWSNDKTPWLLAQLEACGTVQVATDDTWTYSTGGLHRYTSIYDGAIAAPGAASQEAQPVRTEPLSAEVLLRPKRHAPVRNMDTLATVALGNVSSARAVFDMGQNMVGVPRIRLNLRRGDTLTVRFAEMLSTDGELYTKNYRSARSTDVYVAATDGPVDWTPAFTFHGYRYVELSGYPATETPEPSWVEGIVQHSAFSPAGSFMSSHDKLNQLQQNIEWGLRGNFLDIPTDCPQRDERLGWTGDAQVFAPTSLFLSQSHAFWAAWLQSMREEQLPNGGIPIFIPSMGKKRTSSGWGDAAVVIPWELYFRTGDTSVLRENFDMMRKWVEYYETQATNHLVSIQSFNDWLQPYPKKDNRRGDTPQEFVCTAYFARSADLCAKAAEVLGKPVEAERMITLRDAVRRALQAQYFDATGRITQDRATQTAYLLALAFDLLPEELRSGAVSALLAEIEAADGHLRTGFLGTPLLAPVLDRFGHADVAYSILFKETYPGWFYSINQGATTMWERWDSYTHADGFNKLGMNSFNHYAYGAIGQWMYEGIAGLAPLSAGYRTIKFAPVIQAPLTSAAADHQSPFGSIRSAWQVEAGQLTWNISIPPGTEGLVELPKGYEQLTRFTRAATDGSSTELSPNLLSQPGLLGPGDYLLTSEAAD